MPSTAKIYLLEYNTKKMYLQVQLDVLNNESKVPVVFITTYFLPL